MSREARRESRLRKLFRVPSSGPQAIKHGRQRQPQWHLRWAVMGHGQNIKKVLGAFHHLPVKIQLDAMVPAITAMNATFRAASFICLGKIQGHRNRGHSAPAPAG